MNEPIEVLIVEDDVRIAEIHRRFAEKIEGFKIVATASTGEQAIEWLSVVQPQLVLLDVYLPDMQGVDIVKYIRSEQFDIDVIMITAASEADVVRSALQGGVFDFITKPLTYERFRSSLERYRDSREELREGKRLTPEQIESLWRGGPGAPEETPVEPDVPKGIDPLTLERVMLFVEQLDEQGITAETLSGKSGVSRSTARRYLEYLVSQKKLTAKLSYGTIGRPERHYYKK
ncbi:response regulator [Paenibacillus tarimensis]